MIAIVFTNSADADDIGVGAILGAPFMLGTLGSSSASAPSSTARAGSATRYASGR